MELSSQKIEIFFLDHQRGCHDCIHCTFPTSSKYLCFLTQALMPIPYHIFEGKNQYIEGLSSSCFKK